MNAFWTLLEHRVLSLALDFVVIAVQSFRVRERERETACIKGQHKVHKNMFINSFCAAAAAAATDAVSGVAAA